MLCWTGPRGRLGLAATCLADSDKLSSTGPARKVERNSRQILAAVENGCVVVRWGGGAEHRA